MAKANKKAKVSGARGFLVGGAIGGVTGAGYSLWERVALVSLDLGPAEGVAVWASALACAAIGAALGALYGVMGYQGGAWRFAHATAFVTWMAGGLVHEAVGGVPTTRLMAVVGVLAASLLVGAVLGRLPMSSTRSRVAGLHLLVASSLSMPVLIHVVPEVPHWVPVVFVTVFLMLSFPLALALGQVFERVPTMVSSAGFALMAFGGLALLPSGFRGDTARSGGSNLTPVVVVAIEGFRGDAVEDPDLRVATTQLRRFRGTAKSYSRAFAPSGVPVAALGSLLTGLYPWEHGAGLRSPETRLVHDLPQQSPHLFDVLRRGGYRTAAFVSHDQVERAGLARGFDVVSTFGPDGAAPAVAHLWSRLTPTTTRWPPSRAVEDTVDAAIAYIGRRDSLTGEALLVHLDGLAPPFASRLEDRAAVGVPVNTARGAYTAALRRVDHAVGRLLNALPSDAVVVVVGVSGVELDEARRANSAPGGARMGHVVFNEQLHVPLMVRSGNRGQVQAPVSTVSVGPTVAMLAGVALPSGWEGMDVRSAATGDGGVVISGGVLWGSDVRCAQNDRYKLIEDVHGRWELFDLAQDPSERRPIVEGGALVDRVRSDLGRHTAIRGLEARAQRQRSPLRDVLAIATRLWRVQRSVAADSVSPNPGT